MKSEDRGDIWNTDREHILETTHLFSGVKLMRASSLAHAGCTAYMKKSKEKENSLVPD